MKQATKLTAPHEAAASSFYGQSEAEFSKQVEQLAINDPRLIAVFHQTRKHYLKSQAN
ncbi:hypothetical protein [Loktanella sp. S4079]|uniref:hypothetical protein n=1 Tax=Loktanella sp. S4079 TaxID=579483 RepID=UPI000B0ED486|nr:hypothetical protein [Loktanella sp. S4079]